MKKFALVSLMSMFLMAACDDAPKQETAQVQEAVVKVAETAQVAAQKVQKSEITDIDWAKALEMQKNGGALIDVRTPGEFAEGSVPGAVNIPLQEIQQRLAEFPKDKDLLIFCRSGKRSMAASNFLIQNGYDRVFNVVGGILAYSAK